MPDDRLTSEERADFDRLPREAMPPQHLEERVVASLRRAGHLQPARARSAWLRIAAAVALVLGGVLIGRLTTAPATPSSQPAYLLLLYGGESLPHEEASRVAEYAAWAATLTHRGQLILAERLRPERRVVGPSPPAAGDRAVGFFLIRADDLDSATVVAQSCPHRKYGGTIVVRPIG